jgi:hypothetical protein
LFPLVEGIIFLFNRCDVDGREMSSTDRGRMFVVRLCSDKAAYEAVPRTRLKVDLTRLRRSLEGCGECEITFWTRQLMVVKQRDATEITIVDDGRLIIRNVADEQTAQRTAEELMPRLTLSKR